MLSTAITYKDVFLRLKQCEKLYMEMSLEEEWNMAKEICERLKLFYDINNLFSGQNYPTTNTFFIKVCEIKKASYDWFFCLNEAISTMALSMIARFDKYWNWCSIVMAIAVILDTRYKMKVLEFYFPIMYGPKAPNKVRKNFEKCYDLPFEYQSRSKNGEDMSSHGTSSCLGLANFKYDEQDHLSKYDLFVHSNIEVGVRLLS